VEHPDKVADFQAERWVLFGDDTDRFPDAAALLKGSPLAGAGPDEDLDPDRIPDLLFEFVSPGRENRMRDYVEKRTEYHALGVREYVIVDPEGQRATVLRWEPDGYHEAATLGPDDVYTSPLLPGLSIPLNEALGGGE
ncbi:MAG: Uma2 family endonuclease, partial [Planctomycetota bacterium]